MKLVDLRDIYPYIYNGSKLYVVNEKVYQLITMRDDDYNEIIVCKDMDMFQCDKDNITIKSKSRLNVLYKKMQDLPAKQLNRIYEHYILELSKAEIARMEKCSEGAIRKSIKRGLRQLKKKLASSEIFH